ncbi:MAG: hypothetical protein WBX38_18675, partial [Candidatus Sulfotelmatobacter sp.]
MFDIASGGKLPAEFEAFVFPTSRDFNSAAVTVGLAYSGPLSQHALNSKGADCPMPGIAMEIERG